MTPPSAKGTNGDLVQGFKPRHMTMLSIAGIIGAGLFVGSGHAIAAAGPSAIVAYALSGLLVVLVIISAVPWNDPRLVEIGSYQRALELLNIPNAQLLMDLVVLVAVASCLNASVYIASRMIYSLSRRNDAPAFIQRTAAAGVPRAAVIASTLIGSFTTLLNFFAPGKLFDFLLASSGSIALLVYLAIAVSQLRMRGILRRHNHELAFRMWLFPWLTWAVIGIISFILVVMFIMPTHRVELSSTLALTVIIILLSQTSRRASPPAQVAIGRRTVRG